MIALVFALLVGDAELQTFLDSAEKQNVDRRISVEQVNRAAAEFHQAWMALLPSATFTAGWQFNQYEAVIAPNPLFPTSVTIVPRNALNAAFRFELPVIDTGRWLRASAAGTAEEAARARDDLSLDTTRRNTINAYYGYVAALGVRQSSQKSFSVAEEQLKLVQIRREVGAAIELDVMRSKAEVERNRQLVADAESLVAISGRALRTLSGVQPRDNIAMPADDLSAEPGFTELEAGIEKLPAVRSADTDYRVARKQMFASRLALLPTVSAQFTEQFTNAPGFQNATSLFNMGLNLTWRIDGPTFGALAVQSAAASTTSLVAEKSRLNARDQIHTDWQRLNAARTKVTAAEAQVAATRRAAQVARDKYASGAATQIDLIQAERDVFGAEVSQIQAKTELAIARGSLRISAGLPLNRQ